MARGDNSVNDNRIYRGPEIGENKVQHRIENLCDQNISTNENVGKKAGKVYRLHHTRPLTLHFEVCPRKLGTGFDQGNDKIKTVS